MNQPITWDSLGAFLTVLTLVAGAVGTVWWRLHVRIQRTADALAAYKVEVAEKYASTASMREVETRLVEAMNRLVERFDSLIMIMQRGGADHG